MHLNLTFPFIITQLVNGFALGMLFTLMVIGLTIILVLMRVINFTHGVLYIIGAYTSITLQKIFEPWPILAIASVWVGIIVLAIEVSMKGVTILLVEQNALMALDLADRVYLMDKGEILYEGKPEDLWADKNLHTELLIFCRFIFHSL